VRSDPAQAHDGTRSLAVDIALSSGSNQVLLQRTSGYPQSYAGRTVHFWIWVPAGMSDASNPSGAVLFVQTGAAWDWNQSNWINLPAAGGWTEVSWDLSSIPAMSVADNFGIKIALGGSSPAWSGTIYIDSAGRSGLACGTPVPSPSYTPTPVLSPTPTRTPSPAYSPTSTFTASPSFSPSPVFSPTQTPTRTLTRTPTTTPTPSPISSPTATPSATVGSPAPTALPGQVIAALPLSNPQNGSALKLAFLADGTVDSLELSVYSSAYTMVMRSRIAGPFGAGWRHLSPALSEPLPAGIYFYRLQGYNQGQRAGKAVSGRLYRMP
jgi:hypothetical protein